MIFISLFKLLSKPIINMMSLKDTCAYSIIKHNISYVNKISNDLYEYIRITEAKYNCSDIVQKHLLLEKDKNRLTSLFTHRTKEYSKNIHIHYTNDVLCKNFDNPKMSMTKFYKYQLVLYYHNDKKSGSWLFRKFKNFFK